MANKTQVVIVGAGHSAVECAASLRKQGFIGDITLINAHNELPYQRPPLSKQYLQKKISLSQLYLRPESWYRQQNIQILIQKKAVSINRVTQRVMLDDGQSIAYDFLVLATGVSVRKLPIIEESHSRVYYFRNLQDSHAIQKLLETPSQVLMVGAGYIGLELAAVATQHGMQVTILEAAPRILQRVTSAPISDYFTQLHKKHGVQIECEQTISGFDTSTSTVQLQRSGQPDKHFDAVIIGIGVQPNVCLAEQAQLNCDNGIVVNAFLQTNDSCIYAIGDCCNYYNTHYQQRLRLESIGSAVAQARVAAMNICGKQQAYSDIPWFWSDQYDCKLQTAGLFQQHDSLCVREYTQDKRSVFYLKGDRLLAVDAINAPADFMLAKKLIADKTSVQLKDLRNTDLALKNLLVNE